MTAMYSMRAPRPRVPSYTAHRPARKASAPAQAQAHAPARHGSAHRPIAQYQSHNRRAASASAHFPTGQSHAAWFGVPHKLCPPAARSTARRSSAFARSRLFCGAGVSSACLSCWPSSATRSGETWRAVARFQTVQNKKPRAPNPRAAPLKRQLKQRLRPIFAFHARHTQIRPRRFILSSPFRHRSAQVPVQALRLCRIAPASLPAVP